MMSWIFRKQAMVCPGRLSLKAGGMRFCSRMISRESDNCPLARNRVRLIHSAANPPEYIRSQRHRRISSSMTG